MTEPSKETLSCYVSPSGYLQQGDIFQQLTVTPVADFETRIFRASDGRHGSIVFSEGVEGHVFGISDLNSRLSGCVRTVLHTDPFERTHDGHPELVVAGAQLASFFVIATQTCDISGLDKRTHPAAIILPIITVAEICRRERIPFQSFGQDITIEQFLVEKASAHSLKGINDVFEYPNEIRKVLRDWEPEKEVLQDRNKIKNVLTNYGSKGYLYPLQQDRGFMVPESFVDLSVAYTVPTAKLERIKQTRIARIADPYRDQFAQEFATHLSRIAVPQKMKQEKY